MPLVFRLSRYAAFAAALCFAAALLPLPHAPAYAETAGQMPAAQGGLISALQTAQRDFNAEITALMSRFRADSAAGWWLIIISFVYGLLHAAGPGHGKAVISSYLLANNETLKRGVLLAFLSALMQAATAIILVGLVFVIFTGKTAQEAATRDLEIIGAALIMALGLRLLLRKGRALRRRQRSEPPAAASGAHRPHQAHKHGRSGENCACGHEHIAAPQKLQSMNWRQALPLIFSVGIRPCTGALVVMSFALMSGLFALGVCGVLAMSFGTFLAISALAALAVNARALALKLNRRESGRRRAQNLLEWAAALFIFLSGGLLLLASLY